ncbi:MAG: 3'-5' exonuclease [Lachnospiraceae bacterium]
MVDSKTAEKLWAFYSFYREVRAAAPDTPLHELIWKIYSGTGYFDYASALPGGVQRAANLRMLAEKARDYENTSYVGLSAFIRYINSLKRYEVDLAAAGTVGENENAVRIISIHKSKGLEYPVVFVSGMGKAFNKRELSERLLIDTEDGLAADCVDLRRRAIAPTIKKEAVKLHLLEDMVGEELRVLYVALTRAKQKLILTGTVADEDTYSKMANLPLPLREETFGAGYILGAKTPMELLVPAVRRLRQRAELAAKRETLEKTTKTQEQNDKPSGPSGSFSEERKIPSGKVSSPSEERKSLSEPRNSPSDQNSGHSARNDESRVKAFCQVEEILVKPSDLVAAAVQEETQEAITLAQLQNLSPEEIFDPELHRILDSRLAWHYPYADRANIPVKVSVSELKKGFAEDEDSAKAYETPEPAPLIPVFIREREAGRRTAGGGDPRLLPSSESFSNTESDNGASSENVPACTLRTSNTEADNSAFSEKTSAGEETVVTLGAAARGTVYHRVMELLQYKAFEPAPEKAKTQPETRALPEKAKTQPETRALPEKARTSSENRMLLEETGRNGSEKQREAVPEAFEEMPETNPEAFGGSPENEIRRQISAFVESGRMEAGDAAAVETRDIAAFVRSNLGQRFIRAAKAGKLRREQPFAMEAAANTIRPEYPSDETILVQGIIDAYFFETNARGGEEIVLVDYKTDRVFKASQLIERYKLQLDAYADALIRATGLPVSEKIIWSFCLGSEIRVP